MSTRRMIDPAFWQSARVAALSFEHRYLFIGLISNADDQGRMKAHPALIRSKVYPYDDIQLAPIEDGLRAIEEQGGIVLYEVDGTAYLQIRKWWTYQNPSWAWPSDHPAPDGWHDRLKYRRGNEVVTENWDTEPSDPIVTPQWPQSETDVTSAPRTSGRTSTRTSGNDSGSEDSLGADAPATDADYQEIRLAWQELFPEKPQPRVNNATLRNKARTRMRSPHFRANWRPAMERAAHSQFCRDGPWFDLAWFLKNDDHYERCLNGKYDGNSRSTRNEPPDPLADLERWMNEHHGDSASIDHPQSGLPPPDYH